MIYDFKKNTNRLKFVKYSKQFQEESWRWLNDEEIRYLTNTPIFTKEEQLIWFHSLQSITDYYIWGILYDDIPIGACGIKHVSNNEGEYWGYIGEKKYWGKGIGMEMLSFIENEARIKQLKSIYLTVINDNDRAKNLYLYFDYVIEKTNEDSVVMRKYL